MMTAETLATLPDDGSVVYELVNGELVTLSFSTALAGATTAHVGWSLGQHVRDLALGTTFMTTGFILSRDPDTVLGPDLAFVRAGRQVDLDYYIDGGPDLAVEVRSTYDMPGHIDAKVRHYLAAGTPMVIIIDPDKQTADIHTPNSVTHLSAADVIDGGEVVPGWRLPLRELFE